MSLSLGGAQREAADPALFVETHLTGVDQPPLQACSGALEARLGARQREAQYVGERLLGLALDVAERQRQPVGLGQLGKHARQALRESVQRRRRRVGWRGEILGERPVFALSAQAVGQGLRATWNSQARGFRTAQNPRPWRRALMKASWSRSAASSASPRR